MTKDELKLVLEALKFCHGGEPCGTAEAITVVEKALANVATNDTSKEYVDEMQKQRHEQEPVTTVDDNSQKWAGMDGAIAFHLIERHADGWNDIRKMMGEWLSANTPQRTEQEPVAWMHTKIDGVAVPHRPSDLDKHPERWEALYKTPPPCPTCEALARTVMLDQTSHDTHPPQRTWQGLTDEESSLLLNQSDLLDMFENIGWYSAPKNGFKKNSATLIRAIEAKLKQKNGFAEEKNT